MPGSRKIINVHKIYLIRPDLECPDMAKTTLQSYIQRVMKEQDLSLKDVEIQSRSAKGHITAGYVHDLLIGDAKNPSKSKIEALARGLKRPLDEVIDVVFGKIKDEDLSYRDSEIGIIISEFNALPDSEKPIAKAMLENVRSYMRSKAKPNKP